MHGESVFPFWTDLLHLPGFTVAHVREDETGRRYIITMVPEHPVGVCPHCHRVSETVKQRRTREGILDLPIGSHVVELTVRVGQFECSHCDRCFTLPIDFLAEGTHATKRLLGRVAEFIRHSDVANAARFFGVAEKTLEGWYYDNVERRQSDSARTPTGPIRRIGIDELSLKSGTDSSSP